MRDTVEKNIRFLLHLHDCVIIPGFGALVAAYRPATPDSSRGIMTPPGKDILYNPNLKRDDGLLCDHLCISAGISYKQASAAVKGFVAGIQSDLSSRGRFAFPEIGEFSKGKGGKLSFQPYREENYLPWSYGLPSVTLSGNVGRTTVRPASRPLISRLKPAMVILPLTAVLATLSYKGYQDPELRAQLSSVFPGQQEITEYRERYPYAPESSLQEADAIRTAVNSDSEFLDLSEETEAFLIPVRKEITLNPVQQPETSETEEAAESIPKNEKALTPEPAPVVAPAPVREDFREDGRFHLVTGCFSLRENAERHVAQLAGKGISAFIAGQVKGLYRVSAGSYSTREEARTALEGIRNSGLGSTWVWKK